MRRLWLLIALLALSCVPPTRPTPAQLGREPDAAACDRDEAQACVALGDAYLIDAERVGREGHPVAERLTEADGFWKKACALGEAMGCERLVTREPDLAVYGLDQLCRRFRQADRCLALAEAYLTASPPAGARDTKRAGELLEFACAAGQLDRGCAQLAIYLESEGEAERAFSLNERVCREGSDAAAACLKVGRAHLSGAGAPKSSEKALRAFRRACERWGDCEWLGTVSQELCREGSPEICLELAKLYWEGRGVPKAPERARRIAQKACSDGEVTACEVLRTWPEPPRK